MEVVPVQLTSEILNEIRPKTIIEEKKIVPRSVQSPIKTQQRDFVLIPRRERRNRIKYIEMIDCGTQTK